MTEWPERERRADRRGLGQLVEDEIGAGDLRENREQARAGRRLQHPIGGCHRGGGQRRQAERDRRRELLEGLRHLERRVWVGSMPAIFVSAASRETGDAALRKTVFPYFRRNRTVAASQVS